MPELLSPAGNFEKMEAALRYGADAVYLAGKQFGMRSAADNFTVEEIYRAAMDFRALERYAKTVRAEIMGRLSAK